MTQFTIKMKTGESLQLEAASIQVNWPAVHLLNADNQVIAAWFGDQVAGVYPSTAVQIPAA